ncbi:MAG: TRAP transporter fused permease subunit [Rhodospirillaceae bacterium]
MTEDLPNDAALPGPPSARLPITILSAALTLGALGWSADIYRDIGLNLLLEQFLSAMYAIALSLIFLIFPIQRKTEKTSVPWYDWLSVIALLIIGAYLAAIFPDLQSRLPDNPLDAKIISIILVLLSLEGLRRCAGYSLLIIVLIFIVWAMVGHLVPGDLETRKVGFLFFISYIGLDSSGLLGLPMVVATSIVLAFVFFGQLLMRSGGAQVFNDVSLALMGRYRGGSAKISITASSLFGSISGVAVSNIVATGIVTIPLMKKAGFSPRLAASVEAVASTGGQLMPPVMGAVAFLMADFLEVPYKEIVLAALVPSLLYYVALFIQADLEAAKGGIARVDEGDIPRFMDVMKTGWYFFLPFVALIVALFNFNWRAEAAAMLASAVVLTIGMVIGYKGKRMTLKDVWDSILGTGTAILDIMVIVAGAGFIIGTLQVTGLGFAFTSLIVDIGGQNLFVLLIVSAIMCIVLGMGMPTLGVYVLLAILIAPSLVEVGVSPLAAHMFILYFGMMSLITPPVAVAAFFAASIAKAPAMATGWTCMRFGWTAYVVPFLFVFSPSLLLQGSGFELVRDVTTAIIGVWLLSVGMIGYFTRHLNWVGRIAFLVTGALLLTPTKLLPGFYTDWIGFFLGLALVVYEVMAARRLRAAGA